MLHFLSLILFLHRYARSIALRSTYVLPPCVNKCIDFILTQRTELGSLFKSLGKMTDLVVAVAHQSKIALREHLIRARIAQHCLCMYTRPVRKRPWRSDRHIKRNGEIEALCHKVI